jgi:hypothetical protein
MGKSSEELGMSSAFLEAENLIGSVAGDGPVKVKIGRIQRTLNCTARRARAFWNGEVRRVDAEELDRLRAAAKVKQAETEIALGTDIAELREEIERLRLAICELQSGRS